jgi:hypothetical protein
MGAFLTFLADHRSGIWVFLVIVGALCFILQWLCWILRLGRFGPQAATGPRQANPLRFVLAEFFVRLINDFRHLLALVVVSMFALALFAAMLPGLLDRNIETIKDGLQAVAAALAGLIGSIIGYYFGESAATKREPESRTVTESSQPSVQGPDAGASDIEPAPGPPGIGRSRSDAHRREQS